MTSANTDVLNQSVKAFKQLDIDDRLAAMALIYQDVASAVPPEVGNASEVSGLVAKIQELSQERQVDALRDLLPASRNDQNETTLDPNPAKALTELVSGENTVPTGEYGSMKTESKLAFWYQVAQKLGNGVVGIPNDYNPSAKVTELLNSLRSLDTEQKLNFLTQVV
ncbi:orange carotenoid protein N-terminal domain-containing protein [Chroococcidiopsis sp. TS-821]|uniref:orange carotenoid protein N-terminal domain-containing protein n=1 Tax=Chroococcidiopsis sp. TS-821 TaxID=1378066 RepID=UPI000CEE3683|nr:orange carotenoid protein N-terminal domain-containing protein [Chroococcidiopsis sp. TS-821]PPS45066.1 Orange carotenoid-binding protein [Chroococcidiopsis sp. TS-821]